MLTKDQKKKIVQDLAHELKESKGVVFSSFQGLKTKDVQELRGSLSKENVKYKVVKLTLVKRAMSLAGIDTKEFDVQLPLSVSWSKDDEVSPAKIINAFTKLHKEMQIVGGVLDKKLLKTAQVKQLAMLPGKQELRSQLVGVIASPLRGFVTVLSGNLRGLLNVLNAIKESKT